jgi:hypothetical protein
MPRFSGDWGEKHGQKRVAAFPLSCLVLSLLVILFVRRVCACVRSCVACDCAIVQSFGSLGVAEHCGTCW